MPRKLHPYVEGKVHGMKYCPDCNNVLPRSEFVSNAARPDGLSAYCKKHNYERTKAIRLKHKQPTTPPAPSGCTCGDYQNCIPCRNAERRRAFRAGEVPAYRLKMLAAIARLT